MKKLIVLIATIALCSSVFAIGNVVTQGKGGKGPAKVGVVGTTKGKEIRAKSGKTVRQTRDTPRYRLKNRVD